MVTGSVHDIPSNTEWTLQDITQVKSALQLQYVLPQRHNISTHYCLYICIIPVPVHSSPWHCRHFQYYHTHAPFLHGPVADALCSDVLDAISEQHHVPPAAGTRCPGLSMLDLRPPYLARLEPCPAVAHATALPAISNTSMCKGTILYCLSLQNMSDTSKIQLISPHQNMSYTSKIQLTSPHQNMSDISKIQLISPH